MVLAVVAGHLHVDDGIAEVAAVGHRLLDALFHRGDELPGDGAADDRVHEDEALSALERLDPQVGDAELAVTAGLLLVLALRLGGLGDRLPVGDLHGLGLDRDAELAAELLADDLEVGVAHAGQHGLVRLVVAADRERRVLLLQAVDRGHELVLVTLGLRVHGDGEDRRAGSSGRRRPPAGSSVRACRL